MNPASWLLAHREPLVAASALGPVLDLACGRGRNARAVAGWGLPVIGLDRNREALAELGGGLRRVLADLEAGHGIPVRSGSCGAILVFRFLVRPLAPAICDALASGGLLLYETFTVAQRELGSGPRNPAYLLEPGELPTLFPTLDRLDHWEGLDPAGPHAVARLAARKP